MPVSIPNCGTYTVELDYGSTTNAFIIGDPISGIIGSTVYVIEGTPLFVDVTTSVKNVSINRGRQNRFRESASGQPSTAVMQIEDLNYNFSLVNTGSLYWNTKTNRLGFDINSAVRISRNGVYLFTGIITDYKQEIEKPNRSLVTINCSDELYRLANQQIPGGAVTPERSDLRIDKALTSVGAFTRPGQRVLETGVAYLGSAPIDNSTKVLDYLLRVHLPEQGRIWVDGSGNFHFDRRLLGELQNIECYFSDVAGTAIPYTSFEIVTK